MPPGEDIRMSRIHTVRRPLLLATAVGLLAVAPAVPQPPARPAQPPARPTQPPARAQRPRLEPVAETTLLMEALNQSNFRGLERFLKQKPADAETWKFVRGQALLIAETGNLLLMRPPRNQGEATWMERASDLRDAAKRLGRAAGDSDYERSRASLTEVANACNRCHQSFRVPVRIKPFAEPPERKVQR
jgi:hypothetical protein